MADQNLSILVQRLQAVCLFAADIVPTDEPPYTELGWRSGRGLEQDKTGPVFSYERVLAAAALYRMNPSLKIIPSGGVTNVEGRRSIPVSTVIAFELTQLGVPQMAIIEEPLADTTRDQVGHCAAIAWEQGWWFAHRVAILAPCWQFPRITALLAHMRNIKPFELSVPDLISMERVLAAEDATWNEHFAKWYATPEAREMFAKEALGAGQLWAGHQPKYPNPFRGFPDPLALVE
jgi:hypothetical protein